MTEYLKQVHNAAGIAHFFGFNPDSITEHKESKKEAKDIDDKDSFENIENLDNLDFPTEEKINLIKTALTRGAQGGQPLMVYSEHEHRGGLDIHLDILGNYQGVGEALVISTARAILSEAGIDTLVHINAVGDRDSNQRFLRALGEYYRRNIDILPPGCRQLLKKDVRAVLACTHEKCRGLAEEAPRSMNFLSEPSRVHFKDVLEYLDFSSVPYSIVDTLIPSKSYISHTIFSLVSTDEKKPTIHAYGGRYNSIAKRIGNKREIGAVGIQITLDKKAAGALKSKIRINQPRFFFIHVGTEARYRSIGILDILRAKKIPVGHAIIKDKLSGQLSRSEELGVPYILLMGQKECVENSIIVRNTKNRAQQSVRLDDLANHLANIRSV